MGKTLITLPTRLAALLCLCSALSFAESWSGTLVDAKCWNSEENNINRKDSSVYVDRDRNLEVRFCAPKAHTTAFAVVLPDGLNIRLDDAGNARASQLVQTAGKTFPVRVVVTGETDQKRIKVDSVTIAQ